MLQMDTHICKCYLRIVHVGPPHAPNGHTHLYVEPSLIHVPPFEQGFESQGAPYKEEIKYNFE